MRIIARRALRGFWDSRPDVEGPLRAWFKIVKRARWQNFTDVKATLPGVSSLKAGRCVFDIKGNTYRLVVKINFRYTIVYIRFVGTHAAYDKIDADMI